MNKKILLPICLILIAIIGVGFVSAADTNDSTLSDRPTIAVDQNNVDIIQDQNEIVGPDLVVDTQSRLVRPDRASVDISNENVLADENTNDINITDDAVVNDTTIDNTNAGGVAVNDVNDSPAFIKISNQSKKEASGSQIIEDDFSVLAQKHYTPEQLKEMRKYVDYYMGVNYDLNKLIKKTVQDGFIKQWKDLDEFYDASRMICAIHNEAMAMVRSHDFLTPRQVLVKMLSYNFNDLMDYLAK